MTIHLSDSLAAFYTCPLSLSLSCLPCHSLPSAGSKAAFVCLFVSPVLASCIIEQGGKNLSLLPVLFLFRLPVIPAMHSALLSSVCVFRSSSMHAFTSTYVHAMSELCPGNRVMSRNGAADAALSSRPLRRLPASLASPLPMCSPYQRGCRSLSFLRFRHVRNDDALFFLSFSAFPCYSSSPLIPAVSVFHSFS